MRFLKAIKDKLMSIYVFAMLLAMDTRGDALTNKIVGLVIASVMVAALIPVAITQLVGANTTTWGTTEVALWGLLPVFVVIGIVVMIVGYAVSRK